MKNRNLKSLRNGGSVAALALTAMNVGLPTQTAHASELSEISVRATPQSVVVELFTSEGCSSCPPADTLLARLAQPRAVPGARIITLEEHVDYWDRKEWRDPFSSAAFTRRQGDYMRAFVNDQVYTPQMVVQGQSEFVGSDIARAQSAISQAAHANEQFVPLTLTVHALPGKKLKISVTTPAASSASVLGDIFYAVTQDGLSSDVRGGENAGHTLNHGAVVRRMSRLTSYDSATGVRGVSKTITLRPETQLKGLHVVAFIQMESAGSIVSAAQVDLKNLASDD